MTRSNGKSATVIAVWPIGKVLPYAGNAKLGSKVYNTAEIKVQLCWKRFCQNILQIVSADHSCMDHGMVVRADGYEVSYCVAASLGFGDNMMGMDDFVKTAYPTSVAVAFPRILAPVCFSGWVSAPYTLHFSFSGLFAALHGACCSVLYAVWRRFKFLMANPALCALPISRWVIWASCQAFAMLISAGDTAVFALAAAFHHFHRCATLDADERSAAFSPSSSVMTRDEFPICFSSTTALA